jgi:hypothetical protein
MQRLAQVVHALECAYGTVELSVSFVPVPAVFNAAVAGQVVVIVAVNGFSWRQGRATRSRWCWGYRASGGTTGA